MCFVSEATGSALVLSTEALQQHLGAVLENAFHPTMDEPSGQQITQFAPHQLVVEDVVHLNTPFHFLEMVLVVPKGVGTKPLFINKVCEVLAMGDFSHPRHGDVEQGAHTVSNDLPSIGAGLVLGQNLKPHVWRCDVVQIVWYAEERPSLLQGDRQDK